MKPIEEVVAELFANVRKVRELDELIALDFRRIERGLEARNIRRVVRAKVVDGIELAWSANKRGRWRLVFRDEGGAIDALAVSPEERLEAITTGALEALVDRALA